MSSKHFANTNFRQRVQFIIEVGETRQILQMSMDRLRGSIRVQIIRCDCFFKSCRQAGLQEHAASTSAAVTGGAGARKEVCLDDSQQGDGGGVVHDALPEHQRVQHTRLLRPDDLRAPCALNSLPLYA